jgi:aminopeptidase N
VGALAKLAQEFSDTKADVLDTLIELCEKPGFRVHLSLAGALGSLRDARASEALSSLAARELDGRIRRRVRDALDEISQGASTEDGTKGLRAELEKLREANRSLTDRLEKLEVKSTPS